MFQYHPALIFSGLRIQSLLRTDGERGRESVGLEAVRLAAAHDAPSRPNRFLLTADPRVPDGKKKEAKETQKTAFLAVNDSTLFNALHVSSENVHTYS